ncbi:MAG: NADH-quinone oxidoreductase subunit C [bacterium]|nr:NADH-quinone oxidoreductase subunit C [bacterium]
MSYITVKNNQSIFFQEIPVLDYESFLLMNTGFLSKEHLHCVNYYGLAQKEKLKLICCIANDHEHSIYVSSCVLPLPHLDEIGFPEYSSFTARHLSFHIFEREIHENFGIRYHDHPWLKPVRFAHDRFNKESGIAEYPFYHIESEELHEVGVGPIHAGVIEPGHFRFACNGEQILHLEIHCGYQHRGIENLLITKKKLLQRVTLAESIAGDTVAGHATAFTNVWESLSGCVPRADLQLARTLALELERIAIHTGDLSAICTDIAYQLGASVFGRLRTPLINFMQEWCGNRLAKGLIRPGYSNFKFTPELAQRLEIVLEAYERDFDEVWDRFHTLPSVLSRLEKTGMVSWHDALSIGCVGMAAKTSGIERDIRASHPHDLYTELRHEPILKIHGDVYSRTQLRHEEIKQSLVYIRKLLEKVAAQPDSERVLLQAQADRFCLSLTEGWRGEICHCAITGKDGELVHYKIKDPSMHNWLALALAVRNNEISDFPICNKSFDLSYCGYDL